MLTRMLKALLLDIRRRFMIPAISSSASEAYGTRSPDLPLIFVDLGCLIRSYRSFPCLTSISLVYASTDYRMRP